MKNVVKKNKNSSIKNTNWVAVVSWILAVLAHIAIVLLLVLSYKYYGLQAKTFICVMIVALCMLIIADILVFYELKTQSLASKIVTLVISLILVIVGFGGSYYVNKVNKSVNKAIENTGTDQYETVAGVFSCYTKKNACSYTSIDDLKDTTGLKIGVINDGGAGVGTVGTNLINENGINAQIITFDTTDDLFSALVGEEEDENVDIAVFPASLRQRLLSDTEVDYAQYLDNIVDFYSFEEKIKTGENANANKDLYTEPFNILLIGFAPEDAAMTVGLADSIILATVNPQTFTVSLTSIARDSYVDISCNGSRQKINAARGISRQCLMDTVSDVLGVDIDYYMEVNFQGVVDIVDAVGGITINNPVEFVGQDASGIRGDYTVLVPAGEVVADGQMALAFARERHAMPNGDFDRQQHQQEVIAAIVERLLTINDVNKAIKVMEAAGDNFSTNLSLNQLTGIFNYLVNHTNTVGIPTYYMIDIKNMRVTGYASWYYSYSMHLPQWIYKLYNGSIAEAQACIKDVWGDYSTSDIKQYSYQKFFAEYPYERGQLYSDYFNEQEVHEEMPAYYPLFTGKSYAEAMSAAAAKGITLNVTFISEGDANYVASSDGYVVSQYPSQGALVSEYPTGSITVMGNPSETDPEFTVTGCDDETSCKLFAQNKGIAVSTQTKIDTDGTHNEGDYAGCSVKNGDKIKKSDTMIIYKWTKQKTVTIPSFTAGSTTWSSYKSQLDSLGLLYSISYQTSGATSSNNGTIVSVNPSAGSSAVVGSTVTVYIYKYEEVTPTPTPTVEPTVEPTVVPSVEPTPTATPEETVTPTSTPDQSGGGDENTTNTEGQGE